MLLFYRFSKDRTAGLFVTCQKNSFPSSLKPSYLPLIFKTKKILMKKYFLASIVAISFFAACENTSSSTVGSYKDEETSPAIDKNNVIEKGPDSTKNNAGEIPSSDTTHSTQH